MSDSSRADQWLWATRFFKTRSLAAKMCSDGKVRRNDHTVKPASSVQPGDLLEIPFVEGPGFRTVRVVALLDRRVGAPEAQACYDDQTPAAVFDELKLWLAAKRDSAGGRPTKRNRREIDRIHGFWDDV